VFRRYGRCACVSPKQRFCLRCGAPQRAWVLRRLLIGTCLGVIVATTVIAFRSFSGGAPELVPPSPSSGHWLKEEDFAPDDEGPESVPAFVVPSH
jgi:hypothetical protein